MAKKKHSRSDKTDETPETSETNDEEKLTWQRTTAQLMQDFKEDQK